MTKHLAKQVAIFLENKPGALARLCDALAAAKINIYAISTGDTVDYNVIRMVVSDTERAMRILDEHNTITVTTDVLMIEGDNKPGTLSRIAHQLADAKINIDYCYCATNPTAHHGLLILRPSNPKKALKVLNMHGI